MRTEPYIVGEEVKLRSYGRGEMLYVVAPSGIEMSIPAPSGSYTITLSEPGEWTAQWERGDVETLMVVETRETEIELIEQPPAPKPTHPLTSSS